jgi:hypothetical protein
MAVGLLSSNSVTESKAVLPTHNELSHIQRKVSGTDKRDGGLGALATNPPGQLDVLRHDSYTLGVDGAQVRVLEEADQVSLAGLLHNQKKV